MVADLPVGQNMEDHVFIPVDFISNQTIGQNAEDHKLFWSQLEYYLFGSGRYRFVEFSILKR